MKQPKATTTTPPQVTPTPTTPPNESEVFILPDATNATQAPETPVNDAIPTVSEKDIFDTGKGTEQSVFDSLPGGAKSTAGAPGAGASTSAGNLVSGRFVTDVADGLISVIVALAIGAAGYQLDKKTLQLNEREKGIIAPAVQAYLDSINLRFDSPLQNLMFVLAAVYGAKIVEQLPNLKRKPKTETKAPAPTVDRLEVVAEKLKNEVARKERQQAEIKKLQAMPRALAIKFLQTSRKFSKEKAEQFYNKNVA